MALNSCNFLGRLVADPELRKVGKDHTVCSFRIAVDRDYKDADGNREADFIDCTAWDQQGQFIKDYYSKGQQCVVNGRLELRSWQDEEENWHNRAEIRVLNIYFASSKQDGEKDSKPKGKAKNTGYKPYR